MKKIFWLILIFVLGGAAGIIGSLWLAPVLADVSPFSKIGWLARSKDGVTIINKTERITISEQKAFVEGIAQISPSLVGIKTTIKQGRETELATEGNGFILTSDGLVVTANALIPESAFSIDLFLRDGQTLSALLLKKDETLGVAFLKVEKSNLTPVALADFDSVFLAQQIFLSALDVSGQNMEPLVNWGYVRQKEADSARVGFNQELQVATGAPVVNEKGEVVGIALVDVSGSVSLIPVSRITQLLSES